MKKTFFLLPLFFLIVIQAGFSQIKWSNRGKPATGIAWENYSTTYPGDISDSIPLLVTAIPYNGMYDAGDNKPLDMLFAGSLFRFQSALSKHSTRLSTYDSSEVYFLAPGIYKKNAANYEYRVTLNGKTIITPWTAIDQFSDIGLNNFKKGFAFLGGYKTTWGNHITVELRKKGSDAGFTAATVYWKETTPAVVSVYTSKNLNDFFTLLKRPWDKHIANGISPQNAVFAASENNIIYYLSANIYKKEALEYQLLQDEKIVSAWKPNDYDNNFIWLKELKPGKYTLQIRFSKQRHNVSTYDFEIKPAWHQTTAFKIIARASQK